MRGTIVDVVGYPPHLGGGVGYIVQTDDGKQELWPEEALELEASAELAPPPDDYPDEDEAEEDGEEL